MSTNATVACQYKTGRTLGAGTYAIVKEAVHISTGVFYAVKVISKSLMRGREAMVRNEINVLKSVSKGHPNIVTLWDYFETQNNLYLVTDLCSGGELFDRICAKGSYFETDAARLVQVVTSAVEYLHSHGIVHRDLKPENLLFRTSAEDADLLIADFGLSKMTDESTFTALQTVCGTPSYMAPELFGKKGHGKPVDMWAIGVITYFLLCGYTPFDRDDQVQEIRAICEANFVFEPKQYWKNVSETARDFVRACLTVSTTSRLTASAALVHPFLTSIPPSPRPASASLPNPLTTSLSSSSSDLPPPTNPSTEEEESKDLLPFIKERFDAKKQFRKALHLIRVANAFRANLSESDNERNDQLRSTVEKGQREAEEEQEVGEVFKQ